MKLIFLGVLLSGLVVTLPTPSEAALLYFTPGSGDFQLGETATLQVRVDNEGECINAAEVNIAYPKDLVEAIDVSRGDSIFTVWVTPPQIRPEFGLITMIGGIPAGYCGRTPGDPALTNVIAKVVFRFQPQAGTNTPFRVPITILSSSKVVLNDGLGTQTKLSVKNVEFTVADTGEPQKNEWTEALRDDQTPPEAFTVEVHRDQSVFDNRYFAVFSTVDKQTGLSHFEVAEARDPRNVKPDQWQRANSPYLLKDQTLRSTILVKAVDKAGNTRLSEYAPAEAQPAGRINMFFFWMLASLGVIFLAVTRFLRFLPI